MATLEVVVSDLQDAQAAQTGGAQAVELALDLPADGLTPSLELVQQVRAALDITLRVILRPHDRGFVYSEADITRMTQQAAEFAAAGVDGLVVGGQREDGRLDDDLLARIAAAAPGVPLTLHRVIDRVPDATAALEKALPYIQRLLTSGCTPNAWTGRSQIQAWVRRYGDRLHIAAGGGVTLQNAVDLAHETGAPEIHMGGGVRRSDRVDAELVHQIAASLRAI